MQNKLCSLLPSDDKVCQFCLSQNCEDVAHFNKYWAWKSTFLVITLGIIIHVTKFLYRIQKRLSHLPLGYWNMIWLFHSPTGMFRCLKYTIAGDFFIFAFGLLVLFCLLWLLLLFLMFLQYWMSIYGLCIGSYTRWSLGAIEILINSQLN